jgi:putative addiction module component (TIGR02574 family)
MACRRALAHGFQVLEPGSELLLVARVGSEGSPLGEECGGCTPARWQLAPMPPLKLNRFPSPVLPAWLVVNDLLTLPLSERLELVQTLWDSIAAEQGGPELTDADRQLIDRRLESFLVDGDPGLDADAALDAIERSL